MRRLILAALAAALAVTACSSTKHAATSTTTSTTSSPTSSSTPTSAAIGNPSTPVTLHEAGSSLLYPFLQELVGPLHAAYPNLTLDPAAGGSGFGITSAISGSKNMGGSDAYLSPAERSANPDLLNIPIAISAQAVNYNLPGISNLKLSGNVLAEIYMGQITKWNDPAIAALNPGVTLPDHTIVPVHRSDSSGDTFIFTSFLSATNPTWASKYSFDTTITWPSVTGELTGNGNPGVVETVSATPYAVGYVGVSAEASALADHLGEVLLENQAGAFVHPVASTITAAVNAGSGSVPSNLVQSLIYEPGAQSYPIVNFEYIVVNAHQSSPTLAEAIRTFLTWAGSPTGGNQPQYLSREDFVALPSSVIPKIQAAIASIT